MFALIVCLTGICLLVMDVDGFLVGRRVVKTLTVINGQSFGSWGPVQYCADRAYATGYNMKIEPPQGHGDDTSLNAIQLICQDLDGVHFGGNAESTVGLWGNWVGETVCARNGSPFFLTAFSLQVEAWSPYENASEQCFINFIDNCSGNKDERTNKCLKEQKENRKRVTETDDLCVGDVIKALWKDKNGESWYDAEVQKIY